MRKDFMEKNDKQSSFIYNEQWGMAEGSQQKTLDLGFMLFGIHQKFVPLIVGR